jgi:hypothetical protein
MKESNYVFSGPQLLLVLLAGTLVRFIFGWYTRLWMEAPDQLAWQLSIDAVPGNLSFTRLMHAPHEGGTLVLGLFSLPFRSGNLLPSLSWAALFTDTIIRFVQISVIRKISGHTVAAWFAVWTVLAVPAMIPWATVNFGLHALSSVFPFLLLYILYRYREHPYVCVLSGLICALAVSFSYDSLVLLPVSVLFLLSGPAGKRIRDTLLFLAVFTVAMLPHLWIRAGLYTQPGSDILLSVRAVNWEKILDLSRLVHVITVWGTALPGSFMVSPVHVLPPVILFCMVCILLYSGIVFFIPGKEQPVVRRISIGIVLVFVVAYALSPFYGSRFDSGSYVYYRHFSYIIPLLAFICIAGFSASRSWRKILLPVWIVVCGFLSVQFMLNTKRAEQPAYRPAGWILVKKYGIDSRSLMTIHAAADPRYSNELMTGYGWGMTTVLLAGKPDTGSIVKLVQAIREYPAVYHPHLMHGVRHAFINGITPVLDPRMLEWFDHYIKKEISY